MADTRRWLRVPLFALPAMFAVLLSTTLAAASYAQIYVDASCGDDAWAGTSPTCAAPDGPKRTIQAAIDAALDNDEIVVAMGTYAERIDFTGKAITVRSTDPADTSVVSATVIDATGLGGSAVTCISGEGSGTVLSGFKITGGTADMGGGMYIENSSPTVTDCAFVGNTVTGTTAYGGGMYNSGGSPTVTGCTFSGNSASGASFLGQDGGGGMYSENSILVTDCTFINNAIVKGSGAGMYAVGATVTHCTFSGNIGDIASHSSSGGGVYALGGTVTRCTFSGNSSWFGGGMYGNSTVTDCIFSGNGGYEGGGMYGYGTVIDCIFSDNHAHDGGGMLVDGGTVTGCTFDGNGNAFGTAIYFSGFPGATVTNCILSGTMDTLDQGTPTVAYSDFYGGLPTGAVDGGGNIHVDPQFVGSGDLRLQPGSPCIDAGDNADVPGGLTTDFDGDPRVVDGDHDGTATVDMGAYEASAEPVPGISTWGVVFLVLLLSIAGAIAATRRTVGA